MSSSSTSSADPYDSLDSPYATFTDRIHDPETFDDYIEFIRLGNQIKENLVKQVKHETSAFLLKCLKTIIKEQVQAKLLKRDLGDLIYNFVESRAIDKGYAAW